MARGCAYLKPRLCRATHDLLIVRNQIVGLVRVHLGDAHLLLEALLPHDLGHVGLVRLDRVLELRNHRVRQRARLDAGRRALDDLFQQHALLLADQRHRATCEERGTVKMEWVRVWVWVWVNSYKNMKRARARKVNEWRETNEAEFQCSGLKEL